MKEIKTNDIVIGKITGVTNYGIFVQVNDNMCGLIHISEISNKFVPDIKEKFKVGNFVKAKVISIDNKRHHLALSIKQIGKIKRGIIEVGSGFDILQENLNLWINDFYDKNTKNN